LRSSFIRATWTGRMVSFLADHGNHLSIPLKYVETPCPRSSCFICPSQDNSVPPLDPLSLPDHTDTIPGFQWGPSKGWITSTWHPTSLSRYTPLSLLLAPPTHGHWPVPSLSSNITTDHPGPDSILSC
jgi:hypothetical protein